VFGCLLGPGSKGPLTLKQAFLPITFGGIKLILTATIALTTYLGNLAFVASIIVTSFMVDQYPFLFEDLARIDNNTFLFHQHFKETCDFLPPLASICLPLFEQLIGQ